MKMERTAGQGGPIVMGLGARGFRIGEDSHRALLMTIEKAIPWSPPPLSALTLAELRPLIDVVPEFILIGTGAKLILPPLALVRELEAIGLGIEAMDSRAAARCWGVLRGEARPIAAALYPLDV